MAGSSRSRRVPNESENWRDKIVANLITHAGISEQGIGTFKFGLVASCFIKKHGIPPSGLALVMGMKFHRPNGSEYTFQDVPPEAIVDSVIKHLRNRANGIPPSKRRDIFDKVMADLPPSYKSKAIWEDEPPPLNPNVKPTTPFSAPKTQLGPSKSNATLIDDLALAAGLTPEQTRSVRGQITWWDGMAGGKVTCSVTVGSWEVRGGRLGRDHTLEDVPTCYLRDRIMDYINDIVPEEKRTAARRAVFSDLTDAEINQYSMLIAGQDKRLMAEEPSREASPMPTAKPSRHLDRQDELLRSIDGAVDLTPHPELVLRRWEFHGAITRSVVKPNCREPLPAERLIQVDCDIHYDCDQVRAMIKRFIDGGQWSLEEFRTALCGAGGGVTREQLNTFLGHRGERNGIRSKAFQLCWSFFHRREKLSLPLAGAGARRDEALLRLRAGKRRSTGGGDEGSQGGKRRRHG
ncbi:hypothetical protein C8A03DRAFT_35236 [Achaetomium macrosporum]|uniref:DUF7726 domain-containing protein n=1 Tax=Achaetomium macrosporum TaxID=79813 RepID=A0AAN7HAZ7_9PEZI|nr:hypothetical protein C8A03DRAFT_35236 [Achaetomium macrosporum]